ncbi:MAG TPA: hypothetical protein VIV11_08865 [Kofleriaceae bacterium]
MIEATCHCGAVTIEVPEAPSQLTSCNCSICRRLGSLWCYFSPTVVRVTGTTVAYRWGDKTLDLHHCATCGCTTHWTPIDPALDRMGVNARLLDPAIVAAAKVRRIDGASTWEWLDE